MVEILGGRGVQPTSKRRAVDQLSAGTLRALRLAVGHLNVSIRKSIVAEQLWLEITDCPAQIGPHIVAFLEETDLATIHDLVLGGDVDVSALKATAERLLPLGHQTRTSLDEQ